MMKTLNRRLALRFGVAALAGWAALSSHAASINGSEAKKIAVLSLLGSDIHIIETVQQVGSRLPTRPTTLNLQTGFMDQRAMLSIDKLARTVVPPQNITMLATQGKMWRELQQDAMESSEGMRDMVATVTDVARQANCTHALVLMKYRSTAQLRLAYTSIGLGMIEGMGFYIDYVLQTTEIGTQNSSRGVLAPYVYAQLLLIDVNKASLVNSMLAKASTHFAPENGTLTDPWDVLSPEKKIHTLTALLDAELARMVPALLNAESTSR